MNYFPSQHFLHLLNIDINSMVVRFNSAVCINHLSQTQVHICLIKWLAWLSFHHNHHHPFFPTTFSKSIWEVMKLTIFDERPRVLITWDMYFMNEVTEIHSFQWRWFLFPAFSKKINSTLFNDPTQLSDWPSWHPLMLYMLYWLEMPAQ